MIPLLLLHPPGARRRPAQAPRPQRQPLQVQHLGSDEEHKRHDAKRHAQHVDEVVAVALDVAGPGGGEAALLVGLERAAERRHGAGLAGGRRACRRGEGVDEAEDEEAREGAA